MPDRSIIPRDIDKFNSYITRTNDYLILGSPTNAERFGWTAQNLSDWQAFRTEWEPLFFKYSDRKDTYTTAIKNSMEAIIANAIIYDRENKLILKIKATVGLTVTDCYTFSIPISYSMPRLSTPQGEKSADTHKTTMTEERVFPQLKPVGGGMIKIDCFQFVKGSGRAHKPEGYDLLEYKVAVFYSGTSDIPTQFTDTRLTLGYSSKASFMLNTNVFTSNLPATELGEAVPLKMAVFFFRWAKSKHPDLDGPWSGPFNTPLL
ncbi:MAG: hypothetical protein ABR968_05705 [Bacteroidales bacterium]|jgi:hypothetical protein